MPSLYDTEAGYVCTDMSSSVIRGDDETDEEEERPTIMDSIIIGEKESPSFGKDLNGSDVRVGIIMARWNEDIVKSLYQGVNASLYECGVNPANVFTTYVPGSYELPITAKFLAASKRVDVIICIGVLIKGETMHFEYIAEAVSSGIMQVSLDSFVPCIFGVLTVLNAEQAVARSTGNDNLGLGWGKAAVEMGLARISALGLGKLQGQQSAETSKSFVTFDTSAQPQSPTTPKEKVPKKIGF